MFLAGLFGARRVLGMGRVFFRVLGVDPLVMGVVFDWAWASRRPRRPRQDLRPRAAIPAIGQRRRRRASRARLRIAHGRDRRIAGMIVLMVVPMIMAVIMR